MTTKFQQSWNSQKYHCDHSRVSKLTREQVWQIREDFDRGMSSKEASEKHKISVSHYRRLGKRQAWSRLEEKKESISWK